MRCRTYMCTTAQQPSHLTFGFPTLEKKKKVHSSFIQAKPLAANIVICYISDKLIHILLLKVWWGNPAVRGTSGRLGLKGNTDCCWWFILNLRIKKICLYLMLIVFNVNMNMSVLIRWRFYNCHILPPVGTFESPDVNWELINAGADKLGVFTIIPQEWSTWSYWRDCLKTKSNTEQPNGAFQNKYLLLFFNRALHS